MDTFVVGFLSALVAIAFVVNVVGMVYLFKTRKEQFSHAVYSNERMNAIEEHFRSEFEKHEMAMKAEVEDVRRLVVEQDRLLKEQLMSAIDSRVNKLEERLKVGIRITRDTDGKPM
jgi:biopolymer transport protein ExbB/TolQ